MRRQQKQKKKGLEDIVLVDSDEEIPPLKGKDREDDTLDGQFHENLVSLFEKTEEGQKFIDNLLEKAQSNFDTDLQSRKEWESTCNQGLENLGLKYEHLSEPWDGACSATHPLILEAAVSFQSKASPELLPSGGPCKTQIIGKPNEAKQERATRVKDFMNYQTTKVMTEYYPDTDTMLFLLPLYGSTFKKTYYNHVFKRPCSEMLKPYNLVVPSGASDLYRADRFTEIDECSAKDYISLCEEGFYQDDSPDEAPNLNSVGDTKILENKERETVGVIAVQNTATTDPDSFELLHQYVYLDIPSELDIPLSREGQYDPYCVTINRNSNKIVRISRNWRKWDNVDRKRKVYHTHYKFVPGLGFYGLGFFHLLGNFQSTLTAILRSLVDAGELANLQGGFKLKGTNIVGQNGPLSPGEFRDFEATNMDIQKSLYHINFKEPSQTLFQMWQTLTAMGQKFADSTDQVVADSTNYGPVGTTVALLEHSMKFYSAVHKRLHKSQEEELKNLAELNFEYLGQERYPYETVGEESFVLQTDFDPSLVDVIPVSDPNIFSQAQRLTLSNAVLQAAMLKPEIHNMKQVYKDFYRSLNVQNFESYLVEDDEKMQPKPQDPLTDIITVTRGLPIRAFPGQDHAAHIKFKLAWMQDPVAGGQTAFMQQFVPLVQADIREHQILMYQETVSGIVASGIASDGKTQEMVLALAAERALEMNKVIIQNEMDIEPIQKIAQAEYIKALVDKQTIDHKMEVDAAKLALEAQKLDVQRQKETNRAAEAGAKLDQSQFSAVADTVLRQIDIVERSKQAKQNARANKSKTKKKPKTS